MWSDSPPPQSDADVAIHAEQLSKVYRLVRKPSDRLLQFFRPHRPVQVEEFVALSDVSFSLKKGEVLGVVGVNGAGKSTLLQLITGTVTPTLGQVTTHGRVSAILELGAGFNPDFTGLENIYLNAATLGLSRAEIDHRLAEIIDFSGIGAHIQQPVKTYSSGMLVRLAFSIASSVDPDILIIDEALSVGDGAFRRRSFDRIMEIKQRGTTILFCSHVLFHVETFCDRAIWLHRGRIQKSGAVREVLEPYQAFLDRYEQDPQAQPQAEPPATPGGTLAAAAAGAAVQPAGPVLDARFESVEVSCDGLVGTDLSASALRSTLEIRFAYASDPGQAPPSVAVVISNERGKILGSLSSLTSGAVARRDSQGRAEGRFVLPCLPLNRGRYRIGLYLFCERGLHGYAMHDPAAELTVLHDGPEQGSFLPAGHWEFE